MQLVSWPHRRRVLAATAAGLLSPAVLRAQGRYPTHPVRVVNAYSPGGTADVVCRILFAALGDRLGQAFTVENRPGAAGTLAAQAVARATGDGYTLLYDATAHSVNPSLFGGRLPYDTRRDLLPVFLAMVTPNTLMRWPQFEATTVPELIALARANPGRLNCSSTGIGTVQHVSLELFNQLAGVRINHIVYKEIAAARNDLTTGRVPLQFSNVPSTLPLTQADQAICCSRKAAKSSTLLARVKAPRPVSFATTAGSRATAFNSAFNCWIRVAGVPAGAKTPFHSQVS